ncbi:PASTA domain-containing protein [Bifidobacterium jacchi]|uniref:PASTA domain-containing protein n=1 Tax=Bifidobacterium jacchi TaxID=2490545 RepID=A0A5N5RE20_9BIFI|nr:PASTA domain-containing protein [Bifidobacterium jacchi]KAB5605514.1 PASTA domain-containing protein [Bifidobacterium jacchi]
MYCTNCGARNDGGRFCSNCGKPLPTDAHRQNPPSPQPPSIPAVPLPGGTTIIDQSVPPLEPTFPDAAAQHTAPAMPGGAQPQPAWQAQPPQPIRTATTQPVGQSAGGAAAVAGGAATAAAATGTATTTAASVGTAATVDDAATAVVNPHRRMIIVAAIVALAIAAVVTTLIITYNNEIWGGKKLPTVAEMTDKGAAKASDVVAELKSKGLEPHTKTVFSGKPKGDFVGYEGADEGTRVQPGSTVVVRESGGPGVPSDTLGRKATDAADTLESMNVPVHYKQVVINDASKHPTGTVVATNPAPGVGVTDKESGITVGVATKGDGLGVDRVGQNIDDVRSDLESQGYSVSVEQRFSSEKYVGKLVGAIPGPGTPLQSGQSVVLYEGVDAGSVDDLAIDRSTSEGYAVNFSVPYAAEGVYCKAEPTGSDKDCMTLIAHQGEGQAQAQMYQQWGAADAGGGAQPSSEDLVSQCFATNGGDIGRCTVQYTSSELGGSEAKGGSSNRLVAKHLGAFDFGKGGERAMCGDQPISTWFAGCDNGVVQNEPGTMTGATYEMNDFFVYAAAGADIEGIEDTGYFDADALAEAKKQKAVDGDRPFILYRDPTLYKETSVEVTDFNKEDNPFVPSSGYFSDGSGDKNDVKFKPAPSNATAYYLVESAEPDWASLADADVSAKGDAAADSADSTDSADAAKGGQSDQSGALLKQFAGDYSMGSGAGAWGTSMTVNADGTFTGRYSDANMGDTGEGYTHGSIAAANFSGRFTSPKKNPDGTYTLQCADFKVDGVKGSSRIEDQTKITVSEAVGLEPCRTFTAYPQGYAVSKLSSDMKTWSMTYLSSVDSTITKLPGWALKNDASEHEYTLYSGFGTSSN